MKEPHPVEQWDETLVEGLFLVLSNFAIVPVIVHLVRHGHWASAGNYTGVLVVSSLYHMCRAGVLCLFEYDLHRIADYLFVYRAVVWTFAALATRRSVFGERATEARAAFHFLFMILVTLVLLGARESSPLVPLCGFVFPLVTAVLFSVRTGARLVTAWGWGAAAGVLFVAGATLGFLMPVHEYNWAHTLWHTFVMLSMYAFVRATEERRRAPPRVPRRIKQ